MISVVIPAINEERFLPQCLKSLQRQDYEGDYEIIVVDNASTDGTARVAAEFGVRVVSCLQRGVSYARQAGAKAASGDIIVQADADTTYPRDWLSRIAQHFGSNPSSVALAGTFIYDKNMPWWAKFEYSGRYLLNSIGQLLIGRPLCISGANFSFRREAFLKTNGYDPCSLYPDQWGISRSLSRVGKITYVRNLMAFTSTRRVEKPLGILLLHILLNIIRMFIHLIKHNANLFRRLSIRVPILRTPARLIALAALVGIISFLLYGYITPGAQVLGKVYYTSKTKEKVVALTFDDGPNEPYTSQILDILNRYGVKATFFAIGKNVELYPEISRRIVDDGHVLGNHTYSHKANHALVDSSQDDIDIELAQETIFKSTGVKPHLYRPPHGKKSPWELHYLKDNNMVVVTWSVAANESHKELIFGKPLPNEVAREIISQAKPGKIILLHDGYGTIHDDAKSDKSLTVQILPLIIEELQKQGYKFVTVPELLDIPVYNK